MTRQELIDGLRTLNAPNQGMSYHSGGFRRGQPKYDAYTGERVTPRYDPAELNVYSDRAKFLYRLIENGELLADMLSSEVPSVDDGAARVHERLVHAETIPSPKTPESGDGWVLVPREPTEAMCAAFLEAEEASPMLDPLGAFEDGYAAMLAHVFPPPPETTTQGSEQ